MQQFAEAHQAISSAQPAGPPHLFRQVYDAEGFELDETELRREAYGGIHDPIFINIQLGDNEQISDEEQEKKKFPVHRLSVKAINNYVQGDKVNKCPKDLIPYQIPIDK